MTILGFFLIVIKFQIPMIRSDVQKRNEKKMKKWNGKLKKKVNEFEKLNKRQRNQKNTRALPSPFFLKPGLLLRPPLGQAWSSPQKMKRKMKKKKKKKKQMRRK